MLKRPNYIALGLVALLTLVMLNLPSRTTARMKLGIGSVFLPLFGLAGSTQQFANQAADAMTPRRELLKQNEGLWRENQQLRLQARQAEEIRRENERLRQLFGWQQQQRWKHKLANVVLHDLADLNLEGFLVGRVSSVSLTRSQVVLLGDPNCKVAARIENEAGDAGVIGASGPLDSEFVEMSYLSKNAYIKPGQIVKTSGDGGIFPKDIPVGKVADSRPAEYGLATVARVKLGANLNALEQVWVRFK